MVDKYLIEKIACILVEVVIASEFRYAVATDSDELVESMADHVLWVPDVP